MENKDDEKKDAEMENKEDGPKPESAEKPAEKVVEPDNGKVDEEKKTED